MEYKSSKNKIILVVAVLGLPVFMLIGRPICSEASTFTTTLEVTNSTPTTTPTTTPPVTPRSGGSSGGSLRLEIYGVTVNPETNQAEVSFKTTIPSRAKIYFGKTSDFEQGSISGILYEYSHGLMLTGLDPDSNYFLSIEATDGRGVSTFVSTTFSTTKPAIMISPLANPTGLSIHTETSSMKLDWNYPLDPRVTGFRVVRFDSFYPKDQNDGLPIYEGSDSSFEDKDVVAGKTYYYAVFSKADDGSFSSGALSSARIPLEGETVLPPENPFANLPPSGLTDPKISALTLSDFEFIQDGKIIIPVRGETLAINGSENLTIRLPYEKAPEVLKTIAFTFTDPDDVAKIFPFLLRVNEAKTYYEATIGQLGRSGDYKLDISILDFQNRGLKKISGDIRALAFASPIVSSNNFDPFALVLLSGLSSIILAVYLVRQRLVLGIAYDRTVASIRRRLSGRPVMARSHPKKVREEKLVHGVETVPNLLDLKKPGIKVKDIQGIIYK